MLSIELNCFNKKIPSATEKKIMETRKSKSYLMRVYRFVFIRFCSQIHYSLFTFICNAWAGLYLSGTTSNLTSNQFVSYRHYRTFDLFLSLSSFYRVYFPWLFFRESLRLENLVSIQYHIWFGCIYVGPGLDLTRVRWSGWSNCFAKQLAMRRKSDVKISKKLLHQKM